MRVEWRVRRSGRGKATGDEWKGLDWIGLGTQATGALYLVEWPAVAQSVALVEQDGLGAGSGLEMLVKSTGGGRVPRVSCWLK